MATRDRTDEIMAGNPRVDQDAVRKASKLIEQLRQIGIRPRTFNPTGSEISPKARPVDRDSSTQGRRLRRKPA